MNPGLVPELKKSSVRISESPEVVRLECPQRGVLNAEQEQGARHRLLYDKVVNMKSPRPHWWLEYTLSVSELQFHAYTFNRDFSLMRSA